MGSVEVEVLLAGSPNCQRYWLAPVLVLLNWTGMPSQFSEGKENRLDVQLSSAGLSLDEVVDRIATLVEGCAR